MFMKLEALPQCLRCNGRFRKVGTVHCEKDAAMLRDAILEQRRRYQPEFGFVCRFR